MLSSLDAVVFDFDGVLNRNYGPEGFIWSRDLETTFGISAAALDDALFGDNRFTEILVGTVDLHDALAKILAALGCTHPVEDFTAYWFERDLVPCADMFALMDELRAQGKRCYIGTNNEPRRAAFLWERVLKGRTDGLYTAGLMGLAKPDVAFFHHIQDALKVTDPARLLFIDDIPENVEGARRAGWQGLQYGDFPKRTLGNPQDVRTALGI